MKKSVLLVGNFLSNTPGSRGVCEDLAFRLQLSGWRVYTSSTQHARLPRLLDMMTTAWRQRSQYAVAQVDVYSGLAFVWAEAVTRVLQSANKPYLLTLRGGNLPAFARRHPVRVARLLRSASAVTTPSAYLLKELSEFRDDDLVLLPNPIELKHYPFHLRRKPEPRLMWLRAFHRVYNPVLAVSVLSQLLTRFPDASLTMVGPDKRDGSLERTQRKADDLGIADRVSYPGGVSKAEVPHWLNRGDIFLNTTNIDNTPVTVLEAMACGLCVISTDVGGVPYLLNHEKDSLMVSSNDADMMTFAVQRLLTDPKLAETLSTRAREYVTQFDWEVILPQWQKLLLGV